MNTSHKTSTNLVLDNFTPRGLHRLKISEGQSLSIRCDIPHGVPKLPVFWLYRDAQKKNVVDIIRRKHIAVDTEGWFTLKPF